MAYKARLKELDHILDEDIINIRALKKLSFHGIPDDQGKRALCWRLLLNYLPPEKEKWKCHLQEKRNLYKQFISKHNLNLFHILGNGAGV
nr:unnamed protein product [Callosobruchus chinensis]